MVIYPILYLFRTQHHDHSDTVGKMLIGYYFSIDLCYLRKAMLVCWFIHFFFHWNHPTLPFACISAFLWFLQVFSIRWFVCSKENIPLLRQRFVKVTHKWICFNLTMSWMYKHTKGELHQLGKQMYIAVSNKTRWQNKKDKHILVKSYNHLNSVCIDKGKHKWKHF